MFGNTYRKTTKDEQDIDDDEIIESKIKECQRENGRCMVSTSSRLKKKYGHEKVNRVLSRLSARRYRNNKNNRDTLHNVLDSFSI
jgi:hypothetical protein